MKIFHQKYKKYFPAKPLSNYSQNGFTLIELLVVIAIIGVFASTVLASVSEVRLSAESTKKNVIVREYMKALEASYSQFGSYPLNIQGPPVSPACLGQTPDGFCGFTNASRVQASVNDRISLFYPIMPNFEPVIMNDGDTFRGPIYSCLSVSGAACKGYGITWFQKGPDQKCLNTPNGVQYGGNTFCSVRSN